MFVLGEGHGWSTLSARMDDAVPESKSASSRTPFFDTLAQTGMRFANFYAPSPRCTPSRATFFTGVSPAQLHMTFIGEGKKESGAVANGRVIPPTAVMELPTSVPTIAELLKRAGYATAHFGKWHLGRANPRAHGFDENDGANSNGGPDNEDNPNPKQLFLTTERSMDFMTRQVQAGKPFYLQLDHYAARRGGAARPESVALAKSWGLDERDLDTAAADWDLDVAFGMLLKKLDELGIAQNTYVIFTTDHGTPGKNPPFAGGKGTVWEGGLRVPFIIRGPGIKAGACSHVRIVGADVLPTMAELAHITVPLSPTIEGGSFATVLANGGAGAVKRPREEYVVHFPHYDKDELGPASALYLGDFKLLRVYETGALKLFNIAKDSGERHDLASEMPDKVKELARRLDEHLKAIHAQMPAPNPNFDPKKPTETTLEKKGKGRKGRP